MKNQVKQILSEQENNAIDVYYIISRKLTLRCLAKSFAVLHVGPLKLMEALKQKVE